MSDTRTRILAEATRQLTSSDYAAFSVAAVRDALGLSSGSMFHAFPSKAALAAAAYVEGMADYQRVAVAAIARAAAPETALCAFIAAHLAWLEDHRALSRFLFSTLPEEVTVLAAAPLAEHNRAFFAALEKLFERATAAGLMGRLEPHVAQAICIGPAQEYGRRWTRGLVAPPPRQLIPTLQTAALAALATTRPTRVRSRKPARKARA